MLSYTFVPNVSLYSHHSKILTALSVSRCVETINNCRINVWRRMSKIDSPLRNLCCYFAARYIGHGDIFPQTLAANMITIGAPLILNAFKCKHHRQNVVKGKDDRERLYKSMWCFCKFKLAASDFKIIFG